jgi:hypothetical protein
VPTVTSQIKIVGTFRFARPAVWLSERSSVETIFETVIASAAKQSIDQRKERVDCFVAYAPRNDDKIHVRVLATRCVRSFREIFAPRSEGVRDAGCPVHPQPRARILVVSMRTSIHSGRTEIIRQSRTQWFTAYNVISPVIGFLATVAGEMTSANLTPAPRCQDHTPSPSASASFVSDTSTSTASRSLRP